MIRAKRVEVAVPFIAIKYREMGAIFSLLKGDEDRSFYPLIQLSSLVKARRTFADAMVERVRWEDVM